MPFRGLDLLSSISRSVQRALSFPSTTSVPSAPIQAIAPPAGAFIEAARRAPNQPGLGAFISPASTSPGVSLTQRSIPSDGLFDWAMALPDKLQPKHVSQILRGARAGYLAQQAQLTQLMRDSWPMFNKCEYEVRTAVSRVKYSVKAYSLPGEEPTPTAQRKADTVSRALSNFEPSRFEDEDGFPGMIYDLMDAMPNGLSVTELVWAEKDSPDGPEMIPRCSCWVNQNHYMFTIQGKLVMTRYQAPVDYLTFRRPEDLQAVADEDKFLVAKFKGKSGSPTSAGRMRCLTWWWVAVVFGREFALNFAQKYGGPFLDLSYVPGADSTADQKKYEDLCQRAANLGFCVHPNTGEIKVTPAQGMGGDNPQVVLMQMADEACQILLLGQTLTSTTPDDGGGTKAQGLVHSEVRRELLEGYASWIADVLSSQLAVSVVRVNWREVTERPTIEADFTEEESPMNAAQRWQILANIRGAAYHLDEFYTGVGARMPETGDRVIQDGRIGTMGDLDVELDRPRDPGTGIPLTDEQIAQVQQSEFGVGQNGGGQQVDARGDDFDEMVMAANPEGVNQYTHRVHVTLDDPAAFGSGPMYSKKQIKRLRLRADNEEHAKELAVKFYKKRGYTNIKPYIVEPWNPTMGRGAEEVRIRHILAHATDEELSELNEKVQAVEMAKRSGHVNGEHQDLIRCVDRLGNLACDRIAATGRSV